MSQISHIWLEAKIEAKNKIMHEKSTVEACLATAAVVVKKHVRVPRCYRTPFHDMLDATAAGEMRLHAHAADNCRSKLTPSWPSYLSEHFFGVNGQKL